MTWVRAIIMRIGKTLKEGLDGGASKTLITKIFPSITLNS